MSSQRFFFVCLFMVVSACDCNDTRRPARDAGTPEDSRVSDGATDEGVIDMGITDSTILDVPRDTTCAAASVMAEVDRAPVDIIWVVDNSTSMEPAIRNVQLGLNDFASRVAASGLDYRVIMLSLRGTSASSRYPVCIPEPLAGDGDCGNGDRFFHVDVDIKSTQPIEQFLGTLGQSNGYRPEDSRGSEPWRDLLREEATKTIVVVTDDNSRTCLHPHNSGVRCNGADAELTATSLEDFPGGGNPFNGNDLGPGILTEEYGELFTGYTFNAIYGWGSDADVDAMCMYPDGGSPDSPGYTYTALVERTGGIRAQICDQASSAAWDVFFEGVATRVVETARLGCQLALPAPPMGMLLDPARVNVVLETDMDSETFGRVPGASDCGVMGGWHYDNEESPTEVILCPTSCEHAQTVLRDAGTATIDIQFGCESILI